MIYFDNAATTPIDPKVLEEMIPYFEDFFGNASSLHSAGQKARVAVDRSQAKIAEFFNCDKQEIYFTSGATESDNMAILGIARSVSKTKKPHIITTAIEHGAILEACKQAEKEGAYVSYVKPQADGIVSVKDVIKEIKPTTVLISVMYVNNEIGAIQPISEIGKQISQLNEKRNNKILFHTDATQALAYTDNNVKKLGVDLLSFSAHKIYGPKGIGGIYIKKNISINPLIFGGHQQENIRPGTYNVPGIVGLGKAVGIIADKKARDKENQKLKLWRDLLIDQLPKKIDGLRVTGDLKNRTPNNVSLLIDKVEGESVLLALNELGYCVSTGSACSSGSLEPSHVLTAMGIKKEKAHGSLRITFGRFNKLSEVKKLISDLPDVVDRLRKVAGN